MGETKLGIKNADPLIPALFITIACGAISGFHATQSPLMARCMKSERLARPIFYGSMITEGVIALIWATVSSWFFYNEGWREVCSPEVVAQFTSQTGKTVTQFFLHHSAFTSSDRASVMAVMMKPGAMALARMPREPSS